MPGAARREPVDSPSWGAASAARVGLLADTRGDGAQFRADGVVCAARLDELPVEDLPWVIEGLFRRAERFVFAAVRCDPRPRKRFAHPPFGTIHQPAWWEWMFESVAAQYPNVHWQIAVSRSAAFETRAVEFVRGGPFPGRTLPRVWVLADHKPGHTTQSDGLAEELDWPHEHIALEFSPAAELPTSWLRNSRRGLTPACAQRLTAPWPDLVIATGRRTAPIAGWIRKKSRGRTRTVQMGRLGSFQRDEFDLAVSPAYASLYPDSRRIETATPLTRVSPRALHHAAARWAPELERIRRPRLALLVGGNDPEHELDAEQARALGSAVAELATREGGAVVVSTSRRTPAGAADALEEALGGTCAHFHRWSPDAPASENPYLGYLALADALVVTGESASMLAEACATGKQVHIYPLRERTRGPKAWALRAERWLADAVTRRAYAKPVNRRGIERPQRGLEHLSARLLARGFVRTSGHTRRLHEHLVEAGLAREFDGKLGSAPAENPTDVKRVADRVREMMGVARSDPTLRR
jgi:mitochondrial fission protein ELM1